MSTDRTSNQKHLTDEEFIGLQSENKTDVSRQDLWSHLEDCDKCFTKFNMFGTSLDNVRKDKEHFKDITVRPLPKPPKPEPPGVGPQQFHASIEPSAQPSVKTAAVPWTLLGLNQQKWMLTAAFATTVLLVVLIQPPSYAFTDIDFKRSVNVEGRWRGSNESLTADEDIPVLNYSDGNLRIEWTQNNARSNLYKVDVNGDMFQTNTPYLLIKDIEFSIDTLHLSISEIISDHSGSDYQKLKLSEELYSGTEYGLTPVNKLEVTYLIKEK